MRFWVSWWGGAAGDCRPLLDDAETPAWGCSGERDTEPQFSLCAVIDASTEAQVWEQVKRCWPEYVQRFCERKPDGWRPGSRFTCIAKKLEARG